MRKSGVETFPENTKISPDLILRKPDGTLGARTKDKMLNLLKKTSFQIFEYEDFERHILRKVTLLHVEPVKTLDIRFEREATIQRVLEIKTPLDAEIFTVNTHFLDSWPDLKIEVGNVVPNKDIDNQGQLPTDWIAPISITYDKTAAVEHEPDLPALRQVFISFINATSM